MQGERNFADNMVYDSSIYKTNLKCEGGEEQNKDHVRGRNWKGGVMRERSRWQ